MRTMLLPSRALEEKRLRSRNYALSVVAPIVEEAVAFLRFQRPANARDVLVRYLQSKADGTLPLSCDFDTLPEGQQVNIPEDSIAALIADLVKEMPATQGDVLSMALQKLSSNEGGLQQQQH
mmetsp:Transcript_8231/g.26977  ORF Transcript_8231/g.26977 Transcript_8231/m.26977 type:complete len:122 (+) Transcript_8231:119-484(+)